MLDLDDRDLAAQASAAGFPEVRLKLQVTARTAQEPVPWERFTRGSANPLIPALSEAMDRVLSSREAAEFTEFLRPLVESGTGLERTVLAHLTAVKH